MRHGSAARILVILTLSAGLSYACGGKDRNDPTGSRNTASGGVSSSGSASSGAAGDGGTGGSAGSTAANGGSGGSGSCDDSASCEVCVQCALNSPCVDPYVSCVNELACGQALLCLTDCSVQCGGDVSCYSVCEGDCASTHVGHQDAVAVLNCICHNECQADCSAYAATDCTTFL